MGEISYLTIAYPEAEARVTIEDNMSSFSGSVFKLREENAKGTFNPILSCCILFEDLSEKKKKRLNYFKKADFFFMHKT